MAISIMRVQTAAQLQDLDRSTLATLIAAKFYCDNLGACRREFHLY
jgi:hypothetical protein